jgi:hypothetical protein
LATIVPIFLRPFYWHIRQPSRRGSGLPLNTLAPSRYRRGQNGLSGVLQNCVAQLAGISLSVVREFEDPFNDVIDVNRLWTPTRFGDDVVQNAAKFLELIGAVWTEHFEIPQANRSGPR